MTLNPFFLFCLVAVINNVVILSNARQLKTTSSIEEKPVIGTEEIGDEAVYDPVSKNNNNNNNKGTITKEEVNDEKHPFPFPFPFPFAYPPQVPGLEGPITLVPPALPSAITPPPFDIPGVPSIPLPPIDIPGVPSFPFPPVDFPGVPSFPPP